MTSLSAQLIGKVPFGPLSRVQKFLRDPEAAQLQVLRRLLTAARRTEWGRRYDYEGILRASDLLGAYHEKVPIHTYAEMREPVARVRSGATDILWPGSIRYFAASSGTTSSGRIIPVSPQMMRSNRQFSLALMLNHLFRTGRFDLLRGKVLALPGWIEDDNPVLGTRVGQISAVLAETQSGFLRPWQAIGNELGFITHWEDKMTAIAAHTIDQDIRIIVIAPSWCQVLFRLVVERDRMMTGRGRSIGEIWPNLGLIITGGVSLSGYRQLLADYIGRDDVDMLETYGASEGFISFQDDLSDPAMLLHLDNGVFMEFVPFEAEGLSDAPRLTIGDVSVGPRYAVHLTSNSGFWSYAVGDVVRFTSVSPHRIVVTGRTVDMLDKYGEAVFGDEARAALEHACVATGSRATHVHITHTVATPDGSPAHEWLIEFETPPADLSAFAKCIDEYLAGAGHHYQDRREGRAFAFPVVKALKPGAFFRWMEATGKRVSVQTKVPLMAEERDLANAILAAQD